MAEFMIFRIGGVPYGIARFYVQEIYHLPADGSASPDGSRKGVLTEGGRGIPWIDLSHILGNQPSVPRVFLCLKVRGRSIALRVDRVDPPEAIDDDHVVCLPSVFQEKSARWFPTVLIRENGVVPVLNPEGMLGFEGREHQKYSESSGEGET